MKSSIAGLYLRALNTVGRGRVKLVDESKTVQRLQVVFNEQLETRDNTPSVAHYGFASSLPVDTDAIGIFVGGDRNNGVIIATNHQASRPKNMTQGEVMLFDDQTTKIWLKRTGIVIEAGGRPVDVNNATVVTINASSKVRMVTPLLEVTGNITAGGNVTDATRSMAADRSIYNLHKHTGVTTGGGSTGTTDHPE